MPNVTRLPVPERSAAQIITQSVNAAHAAGIPISTSRRIGVTCSSSAAPHWELDPRAETVSPLGCVLLAEQPAIPLADEALAHVFCTALVYCIGIEDGTEGLQLSENLQRGPDAQLYRDGWRLGIQVRCLLTTERCEPHRKRYPRGERCPDCRDGVPVPRLAADEITLPIVLPPEV